MSAKLCPGWWLHCRRPGLLACRRMPPLKQKLGLGLLCPEALPNAEAGLALDRRLDCRVVEFSLRAVTLFGGSDVAVGDGVGDVATSSAFVSQSAVGLSLLTQPTVRLGSTCLTHSAETASSPVEQAAATSVPPGAPPKPLFRPSLSVSASDTDVGGKHASESTTASLPGAITVCRRSVEELVTVCWSW